MLKDAVGGSVHYIVNACDACDVHCVLLVLLFSLFILYMLVYVCNYYLPVLTESDPLYLLSAQWKQEHEGKNSRAVLAFVCCLQHV